MKQKPVETEFSGALARVQKQIETMTTDLLTHGVARFDSQYCMVCWQLAAGAVVVWDRKLQFRWEPCGHSRYLGTM